MQIQIAKGTIALVVLIAAGVIGYFVYFRIPKSATPEDLLAAHERGHRKAGGRFLAEMKGEHAPWLRGLASPDSDRPKKGRALAIRALGKVGSRADEELLLAILEDVGEPAVVRIACAGAIASLDKRHNARALRRKVILAMIKAMETKDKALQAAVSAALQQITGMKFFRIDRWQQWWENTKADYSTGKGD